MKTYRDEFFYKDTMVREIHTYSENDLIEFYKSYQIWKFVTNHRGDGSRTFDIIKDKRVVATCGGTDINEARKIIDNLIETQK